MSPPGGAARAGPSPVSRYAALAALSQVAKSEMNLSQACRSPSPPLIVGSNYEGRPRIANRWSFALDLNSSGQLGSHGSGSSSAISTARDDASGRRAPRGAGLRGARG